VEGGRVASDGRGLDPRQRVVVLYSSIHNVGWQRQGLEMPRGTLGMRSHVIQPAKLQVSPVKFLLTCDLGTTSVVFFLDVLIRFCTCLCLPITCTATT
jgi:hypothetical protein